MSDTPDLAEQAELILMRSFRAVMPRTMETLLLERSKEHFALEQVQGLHDKLGGLQDDSDLRLFLLERATPAEASLIRYAFAKTVELLRTTDPTTDLFQNISARMLRGDQLIEFIRLMLVVLIGPRA